MEQTGQQMRGAFPRGRRERRAYWTAHVEQWHGSGLTQKEYCVREGVSLERFGSWKRRLEGEGSARSEGALVAVPSGIVSSALCSGSSLGVIVNDRYRVEIPERFSPVTLKAVLEVLTGL